MKNQRKKTSGKYSAIHKWIITHYGKATKCESLECNRKSITFQWAKKKDKGYDYFKDNFMELCASCHRKYDLTRETITKMANTKKGVKQSTEHRLAISRAMKGKNIGNTNAKKWN